MRGHGTRLRRSRCRRRRVGLQLLRRMRLLRLLGFHLRAGDEILPAEIDGERQHHGQDQIAIVVHGNLFGRNGIETRRTAEPCERMTARQTPGREREAFQRAMRADRVERVFGARRLEAAGRREQGRDEGAVEQNRRGRGRNRRALPPIRRVQSHERPFKLSSFRWAASRAAARSSRRPSNGRVSVPGRATRT